jgi:hypothetical protein
MDYKSNTKNTSIITQNQTWCDGLNCYNLPIKTISVLAGTFGKIDLKLCENCISIFSLRETEKEYEDQLKGISKSDILLN